MTEDDKLDFFGGFGTDPHILHRSDSHATSIAAAYSIDTAALERAVLTVIASFNQGAISDEVRSCFPDTTPYSSMTARYAALDRKGLIRRSKTDVRRGESNRYQMVMRVTPLGSTALRKKTK